MRTISGQIKSGTVTVTFKCPETNNEVTVEVDFHDLSFGAYQSFDCAIPYKEAYVDCPECKRDHLLDL